MSVNTGTNRSGLFGLPTRWLVLGGIGFMALLLLCCGGLGLNAYANNQTEGNKKQAELTAVYADAANYMSGCINKTFQSASTANANAEAAARLIRESIAGTGRGGQFNLNTPQGQDRFFPLLVQAWPDLAQQQALYSKVIDVIVGCQDDFRNKQSVVLDQVRSFNTWRGNFWGKMLGRGNFPNDDLVINLPGVTPTTGTAALLKMGQPIITTDTADAYETGTTTPQDPFGNKTSSPAPSSTR